MASNNLEAPVPGRWTTGFNDCFEDRDHCIKTLFCPWTTFGEIAEIVDGGTTAQKDACCRYAILPSGWRAMHAAGYRRRLRETFKLPEEPHSDCLSHECCCLCALTQEYRELKNRGADPSLGWQANVEKWNREGTKHPPFPVRMGRC